MYLITFKLVYLLDSLVINHPSPTNNLYSFSFFLFSHTHIYIFIYIYGGNKEIRKNLMNLLTCTTLNSMVKHITLQHTRMIQNQPKTIIIGETLRFLIIK